MHPVHGVVSHYKYALSDEASFEKDEWGPWVETCVEMNDPETGAVHMKTVLRTDPKGIDIVRSFPSIDDDPGLEDWLDTSSWKFKKVFADLRKWRFYNDEKEALHIRDEWDMLKDWHISHPLAEDVIIGGPLSLREDTEVSTSPMSWKQMWDIIIKGTVQFDGKEAGEASTSASNSVPNDESRDHFLDPTSKRVDREKLASSMNVVELNRVTGTNYTKKSQRVSLLTDKGRGASYVSKNINKSGALFFIKLAHYEGEFRVGLARRTFDADKDDEKSHKYAIEWFERKSKKESSWGKKPGFRLAIVDYDSRRKPIISSSVESLDDFLPIEVVLTKGSKVENEPTVNQDCMDALRSYMNMIRSSSSDEEDCSEEEEEDGDNSKEKPRPMRSTRKATLGKVYANADDSEEDGNSSEEESDKGEHEKRKRKCVSQQPKGKSKASSSFVN